MNRQTCLVNLDHPCYGVDIWMANNAEEVQIGRGQGYVPLKELRQMAARIAELERQLTATRPAPHMAILQPNQSVATERSDWYLYA